MMIIIMECWLGWCIGRRRQCGKGGMQEDVMIGKFAQLVGILEEKSGYVFLDRIGWIVDELLRLHCHPDIYIAEIGDRFAT